MAKEWYPIIDYKICVDCKGCFVQCKKGVYDKNDSAAPIVINPENCRDHCHGCGTICPVGAITYYGEDTDWTPPNRKDSENSKCPNGCSSCN